jgi:hypothetical protein
MLILPYCEIFQTFFLNPYPVGHDLGTGLEGKGNYIKRTDKYEGIKV